MATTTSPVLSRIFGPLIDESENDPDIVSILLQRLKDGSEPHRNALYEALANGSIEQQKVALYLFGKWLGGPEQNKRQVEQALKYCAMFEAIVLSRYLNQAEEGITELSAFWDERTDIPHECFPVLLHAGLNPRQGDSIRKLVGNFVLDKLCPQGHDLLINAFLPWATQGHLFSNTLVKDDCKVHCVHGRRLLRFICDVVSNATRSFNNDDQKSTSQFSDNKTPSIDSNWEKSRPENHGDARLQVPKGILSYLHKNASTLPPSATVYILLGLYCGLPKEFSLDERFIALATKVASRSALPEIARDVTITACYRMCAKGPPSGSLDVLASQIPGVKGLSEAFRTLEALDAEREHSAWGRPLLPHKNNGGYFTDFTNLRTFNNEVWATHHKCLSGGGLLVAYEKLPDVIRRSGLHDADSMFECLDALWEETDRQEFPKNALMLAPYVFFDTNVVRHIPGHNKLRELLCTVLKRLQALSEGRVYAFAPLAEAIRRLAIVDSQWGEPAMNAEYLPLDDFVVRFAQHPVFPKSEFMLEAAIAPFLTSVFPHTSYYSYYGSEAGYGHLCVFDLVNAATLPATCRRILDRLLEPWLQQKPPVPIVSKWKTTQQLQFMVLIIRRKLCFEDIPTTEYFKGDLHVDVPDETESHFSEEEQSRYFERFLYLLSIEPLPRYRFLLEWILSSFCIQDNLSLGSSGVRETRFLAEIIHRIDPKDQSNPKYAAALMKIATATACQNASESPNPLAKRRYLDDCVPEVYTRRLMTLMIPLVASPKIIIRHEAQWCFPMLWDHAIKNDWTDLTSNPAFAALNEQIRSLDRYSSPPPERLHERFDPVQDNTVPNLLQGNYLKIDPPEASIVNVDYLDDIRSKDRVNDVDGFVPDSKNDKVRARLKAQKEDPPEPRLANGVHAPPKTKPSKSTPLQTKHGLLSSLLEETTETKRNAHSLILVASLITNPFNLGGLCRIAESMGAQSLYVPNPPESLTKNKDFLATAVSSHLHFPIQSLPSTDLAGFLQDKKTEGWTIVGVEQTDQSLVLGDEDTFLPRKTVLVMGAERTGIPGEILLVCDMCVEIRQEGVIRSLNVQTAAGIVVYEYLRQHSGNGGVLLDG